MAADDTGGPSPLTTDAPLPTVRAVLQGCDPTELEAAARRCGAVAVHLRGVRVRLDHFARAGWRGPAALLARREVIGLCAQLGRTALQIDWFGRGLRAHADGQRRASLADPSVEVLRQSIGGDGRWVARTGAASAAVAVVLVPGVGTTVSDRDELDRDAARVWQELAVAAERAGLGQDAVAVVDWLGYDPPDHVVAGVVRGPAEVGGAQLAVDVSGLRGDGATWVVVVGHSYGGLVAAQASAAGMGADEVVLLGAPGLGAADLAGLRLTPGADLWAAAADHDVIALLARAGVVHGPDPLRLARRLPTSLDGHGAYLRDPVLLAALAELALHDPRPAGTVPPTAG